MLSFRKRVEFSISTPVSASTESNDVSCNLTLLMQMTHVITSIRNIFYTGEKSNGSNTYSESYDGR